MANKILIKRSDVDGRVPVVGDLSLGELSINTFNGRLFAKKDNGSASVIDLSRNDPVRVLGDATSSYDYDQSTYTGNVTISLINSGVGAGQYGSKSVDTIQNGGNIRIPTFSVHANGIVYSASNVTISASDFGTMAVQDANAVNITGGTINGTTIGLTTAAAARFSNVSIGNVTIRDNLDLQAGATVSGNLATGGSQSVAGNLNVTGAGTIGGNLTVTGNISIGDDVYVAGKLYSNDITAAAVTVDGDATITGNLFVQGTTTTVNSSTVSVGDLNLTLAKDSTTAGASTGAGITVVGPTTPATFTYNGVNDSWNLNKDTNITGTLTVSGTQTYTGASTYSGIVNANGGIAVDTDKFTVADATGNTYIDGTLQVNGGTTLTGQLTANGGISADSGVFTVADTTGSIHTSGDLDVDGNATINTNLTVDGALTVSDGDTDTKGIRFVANPGGGAGDNAYIRYFDYGTGGDKTVLELSVTNDGWGSNQDSINFVAPGGVGVGRRTLTNGYAFDVNGATQLDGAVDVTGATTVTGLLTANGGITADGGVFTVENTTGNVHIGGILDVDGAVNFDTTLNVTGATILSSTLAVSSTSTLNGLVTAANGITDSTLTATYITFAGVSGRLSDSDKLTWNGTTLAVTGSQTLSGNLAVTGHQTIGATLIVTGDTTLSSKLNVGGNVDVGSGKFTVNSANGNTYTAGDITIAGNLNAAGLTASSLNGAPIGNSSASTGTFTDLKTSNIVNHQVAYAGTGNVLVGNSGFEYTTTGNILTVQNVTIENDLNVGNDFNIATNKFTVDGSNGNTGIDGTLDAKGNFAVNSNKFTVAASSGNTAVAGTLDSAGNFTVNTNKLTVVASSGNVATVGTLGVQGATTLSNTLDVSGAASFAEVVTMTKTGANGTITLGNYATGALRVTKDVSVAGDMQVQGVLYKAGYEVINTVDTIDGGTF